MKFKPPTHIAEGGVKSSIEDFIYDLPKEAIEELKVIMKEKYGSSRTNKLIKIRGKYKLPTQVMGYPTVQLINDYFNTYFGDVNEEIESDEPIMDLIEKRKSYEQWQASLMLRQGASGKEVKDTIGRKRTPEGKSGNALFRKALLDAEVPTIMHGRSSDYTDEPLPPRIQKHNASRGVPTTLARKAAQANKPVKEEIELDEAGQAKLYRMRQSHGRALRRGDTAKQTAMGNATYDKQTKEDEKDVKRTGSIFNMRAKRMAGNRKLLGISDSFEVQSGVELDEVTIPDHAEISDRNLVKKTITFKWNDGKKWVYEEVPEDEAPGFYARAGTAMKARKTDKFGNLLKAPVVATHSIDDVMATNLKSANDLVATIAKKKTGTKFEIYGKKNGKEYTVNIRKSMKNDAVVYLTTGDRLVELRPTAAGLQVVDKASNRVLLSNGNDMIWESLDLIDVGRMVIEIFEENIC